MRVFWWVALIAVSVFTVAGIAMNGCGTTAAPATANASTVTFYGAGQ